MVRNQFHLEYSSKNWQVTERCERLLVSLRLHLMIDHLVRLSGLLVGK
jgi:hypothetical protein